MVTAGTAVYGLTELGGLDVWQVMGLRETGSHAYDVTELIVPAVRSIRLGDPPQSHAEGALYLLPHDSPWAGGFATIALGIASSMHEALVAAAREKHEAEAAVVRLVQTLPASLRTVCGLAPAQ